MSEPTEVVVTVTALAAGGDGVARDEAGRVTFVPRTAPGDRVRVRLVKQTASFGRAELIDVIERSPIRVQPPCEAFVRGCGGCAWQHVARAAQLEAKQAIVAGALRNLAGLTIEPIADPCSPLGWRRRARFHVAGGKLGLYAYGSTDVVPLAACPQLEPELDAAVQLIAGRTPPDGELAVVRGTAGIVVGVERPWKGAVALIGKAGIVGVIAGSERHGETAIEIEPGLVGGPWDFQQASAAGNAALIALARAALGQGPGELVELYAGAGNLTRGFVADGWTVTASDVARPAKPIERATFRAGAADRVLAATARADAIVLDPPRTGAAEAIDGIVKLQPRTVVYVSCDPATLARDAARLVTAGYRAERAWPIDLMPQTAHVEVVLQLRFGK
ncbi:MAG TPA: TRAM domain-containing protein [Kofleriaceae bacterium]|jgi:23S rRNA (uracil1939-C5)-methyltransferase